MPTDELFLPSTVTSRIVPSAVTPMPVRGFVSRSRSCRCWRRSSRPDQDRHPADRVHHALPSERPLQADVLTLLHLLDRDGAGAAHLGREHHRCCSASPWARPASTTDHGVVAHHADAALAEQHLAGRLEAHRAGVRRRSLGRPPYDVKATMPAPFGAPVFHPAIENDRLVATFLPLPPTRLGVDVGRRLVLGDREAGAVLQTEFLQDAVLGERVQRAARGDREVAVDRRRALRACRRSRWFARTTRSRHRPSRCRSWAAWKDRS